VTTSEDVFPAVMVKTICCRFSDSNPDLQKEERSEERAGEDI
jgi:hypothetical protein